MGLEGDSRTRQIASLEAAHAMHGHPGCAVAVDIVCYVPSGSPAAASKRQHSSPEVHDASMPMYSISKLKALLGQTSNRVGPLQRMTS